MQRRNTFLHSPKRAAVLEAAWRGDSYRDIAAANGMKVHAVAQMVNRAQKHGEAPKRYTGRHDDPLSLIRLTGTTRALKETAGVDALRWLLKTTPHGMTVHEFIGVLIRDAYIEETEK